MLFQCRSSGWFRSKKNALTPGMASFRGNGSGRVVAALVWGALVTAGDRAEAADGGVRNVDGGAKGASPPAPAAKPPGPSPFTDYTVERPGKRVKITAAHLPAARVKRGVDNPPPVVKRPKAAWTHDPPRC